MLSASSRFLQFLFSFKTTSSFMPCATLMSLLDILHKLDYYSLNHMQVKVISKNLVILHDGSIMSSLSLDTVKTIVVSTYSNQNPNPIIAQFPDATAITVPEVQVSVFLQRNTLIVSDQIIGEFSPSDSLGLVTLAHKIQKSLNKSIKSFGFNFTCEISNASFEDIADKFKTKFFKTSFPMPNRATLKYMLPNIVLSYNSAKITLKFNEVIDEGGEESQLIRLNANVHFQSDTLPEIDALKESYDNMYSYIKTYLDTIFT